MLRRFPLFLSLVAFAFLVSACGSKQFTRGEYDDMSQDRLLDDKFNETDMRLIAERMVESLTGSRVITELRKPPVVLVTLMKNRTQEHIDMKALTDKVRTQLIKSGRFRFTAKENRGELAEELQYQNQSGYVDPATARRQGKQIGADFFLTGEITDRVQEVGDKKYVYYKANFNLVSIQTGIIEWADEKEIRKFYKKRRTGL